MRKRLRMRIARLLDNLPGQCWADLVHWAMTDTPRTTPWSPRSPGCTDDAVRVGACYCGKLRGDGSIQQRGTGGDRG